MDVLAHEQEKYRKAWLIPEYHDFSPGEKMADLFAEISDCRPGETVIDLGCGEGRAGKALKRRGLKPTFLDFVQVSELDPFIQQPLWKSIQGKWDYGLCCDVMEHLPVEYTMLAVHNMIQVCKRGLFLTISFQPAAFSEMVGEPLHLTVQPFMWWRDRLKSISRLIEARDFQGEGVFYVSPR